MSPANSWRWAAENPRNNRDEEAQQGEMHDTIHNHVPREGYDMQHSPRLWFTDTHWFPIPVISSGQEKHTHTHTTTVRHWRHDVMLTRGLGLWNWIYMVLECFGSTDKHYSEHTHAVRRANNLMLEPACGSHRCWAEPLKRDAPSFVWTCTNPVVAETLFLSWETVRLSRSTAFYCHGGDTSHTSRHTSHPKFLVMAAQILLPTLSEW